MKNILLIILKYGLYLFSTIILLLTLKLFIFVDRKELEYPNKGRFSNYLRKDFISAEECGICHQEIFNQWKNSAMANATVSSLFEFDLHKLSLSLRGYSENDVEWCYQCHAPLALMEPLDLTLSDPMSKTGVTCMICHTTAHVVADSNAGNFFLNPTLLMNGPFDDAISNFHKTNKSELFSENNSDLCSSCHYSVYPRNNAAIDWTWKEWDEIENNKKSCKECHMTEYLGKSANKNWVPMRKLRNHSFKGGGLYNPDFIKTSAKLDVDVDTIKNELNIFITNNCGHSLPTGNGSAPALELKVLDELENVTIYKEFFKSKYFGHFGLEVLDPIISKGEIENSSLKAFQTIMRKIPLIKSLKSKKIKIMLIFHYWLPYEKEYQFKSLIKTILNYLILPEVNIITIIQTLRKENSWKTINQIKNIEPKPKYVIDEKYIIL